MKGKQREEKAGPESEAEGEAGSRIDKSSNTRAEHLVDEPAEVQNGFCRNETITLTKEPV